MDASFSNALNKVGIVMCIRDDHGRFVLARTNWLSHVLEVDAFKVVGFMKALKWVQDLQLFDMDFGMFSIMVLLYK